MRNFVFIHIINYIIEKEIHIFVHENNYKKSSHSAVESTKNRGKICKYPILILRVVVT